MEYHYYIGALVIGIAIGYVWSHLTWDEVTERKRILEKAQRKYRNAVSKKD